MICVHASLGVGRDLLLVKTVDMEKELSKEV